MASKNKKIPENLLIVVLAAIFFVSAELIAVSALMARVGPESFLTVLTSGL